MKKFRLILLWISFVSIFLGIGPAPARAQETKPTPPPDPLGITEEAISRKLNGRNPVLPGVVTVPITPEDHALILRAVTQAWEENVTPQDQMRYAVTDWVMATNLEITSKTRDYWWVSLAAYPALIEGDFVIPEVATWWGTALVEFDTDTGSRRAAVDGTALYSEIVAGMVSTEVDRARFDSAFSQALQEKYESDQQIARALGVDYAPRAVEAEYYGDFPMEAGKKMVYGSLGIHDAGWNGVEALQDWLAVDFVSWIENDYAGMDAYNHLGATIEVMYTCHDANNISVVFGFRSLPWVVDPVAIYTHFVPLYSFPKGEEYSDGEPIGLLAMGTFENAGCGYTSQQADHYHLHYGFPDTLNFDGSSLTWGGYYFDVATEEFTSTSDPGDVVAAGGILRNSDGSDDPPVGGAPGNHVWTFLLDGLIELIQVALVGMPDHQAMNLALTVGGIAAVVLRLTWLIVLTNFNMVIPMLCLGVWMVAEAIRMVIAIGFFIKRSIPVIG